MYAAAGSSRRSAGNGATADGSTDGSSDEEEVVDAEVVEGDEKS